MSDLQVNSGDNILKFIEYRGHRLNNGVDSTLYNEAVSELNTVTQEKEILQGKYDELKIKYDSLNNASGHIAVPIFTMPEIYSGYYTVGDGYAISYCNYSGTHDWYYYDLEGNMISSGSNPNAGIHIMTDSVNGNGYVDLSGTSPGTAYYKIKEYLESGERIPMPGTKMYGDSYTFLGLVNGHQVFKHWEGYGLYIDGTKVLSSTHSSAAGTSCNVSFLYDGDTKLIGTTARYDTATWGGDQFYYYPDVLNNPDLKVKLSSEISLGDRFMFPGTNFGYSFMSLCNNEKPLVLSRTSVWDEEGNPISMGTRTFKEGKMYGISGRTVYRLYTLEEYTNL